MSRSQTVYFPTLDRIGQKTIDWVLERHHAAPVLAWYEAQGYLVHSRTDVTRLPPSLVEERVSRLRDHWRRWLFGESAAVLFVGPFGLLIGGPFLSVILMAWAVEMGWAYGFDMAEAMRIDALRSKIHRRLLRALGFPVGLKNRPSHWRGVAGTLLFWGFGPELKAADAVMAEIRREFRQEWESRHEDVIRLSIEGIQHQ